MKTVKYAVTIDGDTCEIHINAVDESDARIQYLAQIAKRVYVIKLKDLLSGKNAPNATEENIGIKASPIMELNLKTEIQCIKENPILCKCGHTEWDHTHYSSCVYVYGCTVKQCACKKYEGE